MISFFLAICEFLRKGDFDPHFSSCIWILLINNNLVPRFFLRKRYLSRGKEDKV